MDFLTFEKEVKDGLTTRFRVFENNLEEEDIGRNVLMDAYTDGITSEEYLDNLMIKHCWYDFTRELNKLSPDSY